MKHLVPILRVSFFILTFCIFCAACRPTEDHPSVSLVSKDGKAVAVVIRGSFVENSDITNQLTVRLINPSERHPVLGDFRKEGREVIFEPVVPFTKGLRYEILLNDTLLSEIEIPRGDSAPALQAIYPTQDTLPENLLKMYFEFSEPMVEGGSLSHLTLIQNDRDTLRGAFLDLQPELWNTDGTVLTIWLDPGRIKRDLIPNKQLGNPLKDGDRYTLYVDKSWTSKSGVSLSERYSKTFVVTKRDEQSPDVLTWKVLTPPPDSKQAMEIQFPQALDYFLLTECIAILHSDGDPVPGTVKVTGEERMFRFVPEQVWTKGRYALQVESRLEDLAGNNLNRPFDRNIEKENDVPQQKIFTREFEIQ